MKRKIVVFGMIFCLALSACGGEQTPTVSAEDVRATAQSAAFTMVAATQQSFPTDTPLPPTATASPTPLPTETPTSSPTIDPLLPTVTFTLAPQSSAPTQDNCNKILSAWTVPTIKIVVSNETKPKGTVTLSLYVVTAFGECGYIPAYGGSFSGPAGYYSAFALVDGKKDFQVSGGFLLNGGSWTVIIRNEQIVAKGGCYPNC